MTATDSKPIAMDSEELVALFRRTSKLMARIYHRRARAHHAQGHVFSIIKERGSIKQRELLELLDVRSSSLSEVLGKLERSGLIVRRRNEKDKRGFLISVKEDAESDLLTQPDNSQQSANDLFACLQEEERHHLGELLNKVIQSLENESLSHESPHKAHGHGRHHHKHGGRHGRIHKYGRSERPPRKRNKDDEWK